MPAGALFAQVEAFQTVNPVCFLVVNRPAFPPQLNMNTRATVADPGIESRGLAAILTAQMPVFICKAFDQWACEHDVGLRLIQTDAEHIYFTTMRSHICNFLKLKTQNSQIKNHDLRLLFI